MGGGGGLFGFKGQKNKKGLLTCGLHLCCGQLDRAAIGVGIRAQIQARKTGHFPNVANGQRQRLSGLGALAKAEARLLHVGEQRHVVNLNGAAVGVTRQAVGLQREVGGMQRQGSRGRYCSERDLGLAVEGRGVEIRADRQRVVLWLPLWRQHVGCC